jgi:hypothetical protein
MTKHDILNIYELSLLMFYLFTCKILGDAKSLEIQNICVIFILKKIFQCKFYTCLFINLYYNICFFFFAILEFELRDLHFLGRNFSTWAYFTIYRRVERILYHLCNLDSSIIDLQLFISESQLIEYVNYTKIF